jgi:hypothetical protein
MGMGRFRLRAALLVMGTFVALLGGVVLARRDSTWDDQWCVSVPEIGLLASVEERRAVSNWLQSQHSVHIVRLSSIQWLPQLYISRKKDGFGSLFPFEGRLNLTFAVDNGRYLIYRWVSWWGQPHLSIADAAGNSFYTEPTPNFVDQFYFSQDGRYLLYFPSFWARGRIAPLPEVDAITPLSTPRYDTPWSPVANIALLQEMYCTPKIGHEKRAA